MRSRAARAVVIVGAAMLLGQATAGELEIYDRHGQRQGVIVPGPGGRVDLYDRAWQRQGYGYQNRDGSIDLYDRDSNRLGTLRPASGPAPGIEREAPIRWPRR